MRELTDRDWAKALVYLDEKAEAINGTGASVKPRVTKPKGPTPTQERKAAMERAREARG